MFVRIGSRGNGIEKWSERKLAEFLTIESLIGKKGEPKEEIEIFRGGFIFPVGEKTQQEKGPGVPWVFSSYDLDRYAERIDPEGWELANFRKNPVVQWAHNHNVPAIGRAENIAVREGSLTGNVLFNEREYDEFGWAVGERVKRGVIRAGSVGFLVLKVEIPDPKKNAEEEAALIYRRQELLEFSICNVPANPFALAEGEDRPAGRDMKKITAKIARIGHEIDALRMDLFEKDLIDESRMSGEEKFWRGLFRENWDAKGN